MRNTGFLFYKEYFKQLTFEIGKPKLNFNNNDLYDLKLNYNVSELFSTEEHFELFSVYPGLLIGSGYNHEIGEQKNELKLGFFFDHTTGLPCIPGSSVKGVLRDACKKNEGQYILSILRELAEGERKSELKDDEKKILEDEILSGKILGKISLFVMQVFEGKIYKDNYIPLSQRDIFFDAFPIKSENENQKFLANDYITHHESPFKNPNPIQFLKVLPQVVFQFNFKLSDEPFSKKIKLELFRQILLDLGVGAKTNVGYGQFTNYLSISENKNTGINDSNNHNLDTVTKPKQSIPAGVTLNKNEEYLAELTSLAGGYSIFKFSKEGNECIVRKKTQNIYEKLSKKGYEGELKAGDKVTIKIQADYLSNKGEVSFQVLILGSIN